MCKQIIAAGAALRDISFSVKVEKDSELAKLLSVKWEFNEPVKFRIIEEASGDRRIKIDVPASQAAAGVASLGEHELKIIAGPTFSPGGGSCNAIRSIKKLIGDIDVDCKLVAKIGAQNGVPDADGKALKDNLASIGIDTDLIQLDDKYMTGRSLVLQIIDGNVQYLIYRGASMNLQTEDLENLNLEDVIGGVVANMQNPEVGLKFIDTLARAGKKVVYISSKNDMEYLKKTPDLPFKEFAENVVMTANEGEFDTLGDDATKNRVLANFAKAFISRGTEDTFVYEGNLKNKVSYPIAPDRPVNEVPKSQINPNGAGDAMSACLAVDWILNGKIDERSIDLALCVAASVCTQPSTTAGVPTFANWGDGDTFIEEWRGTAKFDFAKWKIQ